MAIGLKFLLKKAYSALFANLLLCSHHTNPTIELIFDLRQGPPPPKMYQFVQFFSCILLVFWLSLRGHSTITSSQKCHFWPLPPLVIVSHFFRTPSPPHVIVSHLISLSKYLLRLYNLIFIAGNSRVKLYFWPKKFRACGAPPPIPPCHR